MSKITSLEVQFQGRQRGQTSHCKKQTDWHSISVTHPFWLDCTGNDNEVSGGFHREKRPRTTGASHDGVEWQLAREIQRSHVNLVVAIDTSGSMALPMSEGTSSDSIEMTDDMKAPSKLTALSEWIPRLLSRLERGDQFGIVRYNNDVEVIQDVSEATSYDLEDLQNTIVDFRAIGGANLSAGFKKATEMLDPWVDDEESVNRILFVSDSLPSAAPGQSPAISQMQKAVEDGIAITFIGIDCDPTMELRQALSQFENASQYYINSFARFDGV